MACQRRMIHSEQKRKNGVPKKHDQKKERKDGVPKKHDPEKKKKNGENQSRKGVVIHLVDLSIS